MKKQKSIYSILGLTLYLLFFTSCDKNLEIQPLDESVITSVSFYKSEQSYKEVLAKIYGGLTLTGQKGPDDSGLRDIKGEYDEGFTSYFRSYWYMQDMTTEMGLWSWTDNAVSGLQVNQWNSDNTTIKAMYYRIYFQIALANEFIRESSEGKLSDHGVAETEQIKLYRAEARFLRALSYYHALDLFGSVPFVTENDGVGLYSPTQISKADLFKYIETELLEIENLMAEPKKNVYGRVDRVAAWALLMKLYLNSEVYTGTKKYTEAITYAKKVIGSAYQLDDNYQHLFLADNHTSPEIILSAVNDGQNAMNWGIVTVLTSAAWTTDMGSIANGVNAWGGGLRARKQLIDKFTDYSGNTDKRAMFYSNGRSLSATDVKDFKTGYSVMKYKNITQAGALGSNSSHADIDFPILRSADAYLTYAEAVLRGGTGGTLGEALDYVNDIRERAYGNTTGNIASGDLTLQYILDERAREFYWEGYRRTDLVRYGLYTSPSYLWEWKGGVYEGKGLENKYNHFPIPDSDIAANPNLKQTDY